MTEDDYWERVRDIRKDEQILYDKRYTTAGEWEHINEPRFQNHKRRFVSEWEEA